MPSTRRERLRARATVLALAAVLAIVACQETPPHSDIREIADEGRHEEAASLFEAALQNDESDPVAVSGLCRSMRSLGKLADLDDRFASVGNPGGRLGRGLILLYKGDVDTAEDELAAARDGYAAASHKLGQAIALSALGVIDFYYRNEIDRAFERLNEGAAFARDAGDVITIAEIRTNQATAHLGVGDDEAALEAFQIAGDLFERTNMRAAHARVLSGLAGIHTGRSDLVSAERVMRSAVETLTVRGDEVGVATAALRLADILQRRGEHDQAIVFAMQGEKAARRIEDPHSLAQALEVRAASLIATGQLATAEELLGEAASILADQGNVAAQASVWTDMGNLALASFDVSSALDWYRKSLEANRSLDQPLSVAVDRINLGNALLRQGRWADAAREFVDAHELSAEDPSTALRAKVGLARVEDALGNRDAATSALREALSAARDAGDRPHEAEILAQVAFQQLESGEFQSAVEHFEAARDLFTSIGQPIQALQQSLNIGQAALEAGELGKAKRVSLEASKDARRLQRFDYQALLLTNLGNIELREGDPQSAINKLLQAADLHTAVVDDEALLENLLLTAQAHERRGDTEEARRYLERAVGLEDRVFDRIGGADLSLGRRERIPSASRQLALLLATLGDPEESFVAFHSGIARSLRNRRGREGIESDTPSARAWALAEGQVAAARTRLRDGTLSTSEREHLATALRSAEHRSSVELRRVLAETPASTARSSIQLTKIRSRLNPDEAVVAYLLEEPRSIAWTIREGEVKLHSLPSKSELVAPIARLTVAIESGVRSGSTAAERAAFTESARAIATGFLEPLRADLRGVRKIAFIADAEMQRVPLHALRIEDEGELRWLAESTEVSILPHFDLIDTEVIPEDRRADYIHAFGDPTFGTSPESKWAIAGLPDAVRPVKRSSAATLLPLPGSGDEVRDVVKVHGNQVASAFTGPNATEDAFKQSIRDGVKVLHVASHAVTDDQVIGRSAILFSLDEDPVEDGYLTLAEIGALPLDGQLVILSACQTVGNRSIVGEGLHGLAQAFLAAGARTVVATYWPVEDRATAQAMHYLHSGLSKGWTIGQAVQSMQLHLLESSEATLATPVAWAAFAVIGDSRFRLNEG